MAFYRPMLAALLAGIITSPVFAENATSSVLPEESVSSSVAASNAAQLAQEKVNVNTATVKQLMKVKGLTKAKAKAIVAYRKTHGNFQSLDELTSNVKVLKNLQRAALQQLTVE